MDSIIHIRTVEGLDWFDPRDEVHKELQKPALMALALRDISENVNKVIESVESTQDKYGQVDNVADLTMNYSIDNISAILLGSSLDAINGSTDSQVYKEDRSGYCSYTKFDHLRPRIFLFCLFFNCLVFVVVKTGNRVISNTWFTAAIMILQKVS